MASNIFYSGFQKSNTHLLSSPLPQPSPVRDEEADSYFFSKDHNVPPDLARLILNRVSDAELARMQLVNRKWYWVVVKCPQLMDRLIISSCINAGKKDIEDLRMHRINILSISSCITVGKEGIQDLSMDMSEMGEVYSPPSRNDLWKIWKATLAIAKVDLRFLETAKVAAFEIEDPRDAARAIKDFVKEVAQRDIKAANATALTIEDPLLKAEALKVIAEVEDYGRNEGIRAVAAPLSEVANGITTVSRDKAMLLGLNLLAAHDLEGAKKESSKSQEAYRSNSRSPSDCANRS